jgi:hypothetical protein
VPFGLGFGELVVVMVIPFLAGWRIVSKAGYSALWALLLFVPLVNVVALLVFAFSEWPLERRAAGRGS